MAHDPRASVRSKKLWVHIQAPSWSLGALGLLIRPGDREKAACPVCEAGRVIGSGTV